MTRTRYLLIQTFIVCLVVIFFMEYTLPATRSLISSLNTPNVTSSPSFWDRLKIYEKNIALVSNLFTILGPFLGVFLSYLLSRLVKDVENKDAKKVKK